MITININYYRRSDCNEKAHSPRKGHRVVDVKIEPGTCDAVFIMSFMI